MKKDEETWCVPQGHLTLGGKIICGVSCLLQEVAEMTQTDEG